MSDIVIQVDSLSKFYRLGVISTGTLSHDLNRWWATLRGKPDPTLRIDQVRKNDNGTPGKSRDNDYLWALKDVSFEVKQGEVLGIIGRNGAGKSTLLKILSRVTSPTTGECRVKGRIASLLEVGTGFHPELTGRENIFLNGTILGMTKDEIRKKFDEIVAFSEIEKYIDTPVKRYSSGMYVRLAFAVAAHLDPEILILDEVLAVGDASFQKKCLGKMGDVAKGGRTVLFVSHNMTAIKSLCERTIVLESGGIKFDGSSPKGIDVYLENLENMFENKWDDPAKAPGKDKVRFKSARILVNGSLPDQLYVDTQFDLVFEFWNYLEDYELHLSLHLLNSDGTVTFVIGSPPQRFSKGLLKFVCTMPANFLNDNHYRVMLMIARNKSESFLILEDLLSFTIQDTERQSGWMGKWPGVIRPKLEWQINVVQANTPITDF